MDGFDLLEALLDGRLTLASLAADIVRAMDGGKAVIYTPWFWRPIMWILRSVPEAMFRRLRL